MSRTGVLLTVAGFSLLSLCTWNGCERAAEGDLAPASEMLIRRERPFTQRASTPSLESVERAPREAEPRPLEAKPTQADLEDDTAAVQVSFCTSPHDVLWAGWFALDDSGRYEQIEVHCQERQTHRFELRAGEVAFVVARVDDDSPRYTAQRLSLDSGDERELDLRIQDTPLRPNMVELVDDFGLPIAGATLTIEPDLVASQAGTLRWINRYGRRSDARGVVLLLSQDSALRVSVQLPGFAQPLRFPFQPGQAQLHVPALRTTVCRFRGADGEEGNYGHVFLRAIHENGSSSYRDTANAVRSGDYAFAWPSEPATVLVESPGFTPATLRSPEDDCELVRYPAD